MGRGKGREKLCHYIIIAEVTQKKMFQIILASVRDVLTRQATPKTMQHIFLQSFKGLQMLFTTLQNMCHTCPTQ